MHNIPSDSEVCEKLFRKKQEDFRGKNSESASQAPSAGRPGQREVKPEFDGFFLHFMKFQLHRAGFEALSTAHVQEIFTGEHRPVCGIRTV